MSVGAEATTALARLQPLLTPAASARAGTGLNQAGYLDLLERDLASTGPTQDLMVSRLVPAIYERWWRPALGRVFKGATGPGMAEEIRIARLLLGLGEGDTVLDVACGPGNFSREFARTVGSDGLVVGIDASRTMLERGGAELRHADPGNLVLVRGDATALPFAGGGFDAACCFAALHLFDDPFAALDEIVRVLRPGGRIALLTSVRRELTVRPLKPLLERASGMRIFEGDEIVGALEQRGFTEIHRRLSGLTQFVGGRLGTG
jgi:ubiquinone/menaquinone biosynthesis C-methylase UbiE